MARIVHAPTARAEETAVALAEGLLQAVARYGIDDVTVEEPEPVDALPQLPDRGSTGRELDITAAFQEFANVLEGYERHGGGDRPGLDGRDGPHLPHPVRRRRPDHACG